MTFRLLGHTVYFLFWGLALAACGGRSAEAVSSTATPSPPTAAPTAAAPTPDISAYLQLDLSGGDPEQGFNVFIAHECKSCHAGVRPERGPKFRAIDDLPPIMKRGELRIADPAYEGQATTNLEYVIESIFIPEAYAAPGEWNVTMPDEFAEKIEEEDLVHLLAWIKTYNETVEGPPPTDTPPEIEIDLGMEIAEDGDPLRGRNAAVKYRCFGCHADDKPEYGPPFTATEELPHILERGELRIADPAYEGRATTNQEYILESIFIPEAYVLPGEWEESMPDTFHLRITDTELANIMAWIASLE